MRATRWNYLRCPMPAEPVDDRDTAGDLRRRQSDVLDAGRTVARITSVRDQSGYCTITCVIFSPQGVLRQWQIAEDMEEWQMTRMHAQCVRDTIVSINSNPQ